MTARSTLAGAALAWARTQSAPLTAAPESRPAAARGSGGCSVAPAVRTLVVAMLTAGFAGAAASASAVPDAATSPPPPATRTPMAATGASPAGRAAVAGDAAALGERLAREGRPPAVLACASCHGANGEGIAAFPPLAGTGRAYLHAQLEAYADGSRQNPIMGPIANAMSAAERAAAAAYFSSLPQPAPAPAARADKADGSAAKTAHSDPGAWLVTRGRWSDEVPACVQCHGPAGEGIGAHFPPIARLDASYMQQQIQAWKDGTRPPGPLALMQAIARKLSDDDVAAVAAHYRRVEAAAAASRIAPNHPNQEVAK